MSSKEKTSSQKTNNLFKLSKLIHLTLLVLLILSSLLIFNLATEFKKLKSEALSYEDLKHEVKDCQNHIRYIEASYDDIRTDIADAQKIIKTDAKEPYEYVIDSNSWFRSVIPSSQHEYFLGEIEAELSDIENTMNNDFYKHISFCKFPSVPNDSFWSPS